MLFYSQTKATARLPINAIAFANNYGEYHLMTYSKQSISDFDALALELKHVQDYEQSQKQYFESNYEIDADNNWYGCLYRVWDGVLLIGTFYFNSLRWCAEPYYSNRTYIRSLKSLSRVFNSNQKAINYIIRSYESQVTGSDSFITTDG